MLQERVFFCSNVNKNQRKFKKIVEISAKLLEEEERGEKDDSVSVSGSGRWDVGNEELWNLKKNS